MGMGEEKNGEENKHRSLSFKYLQLPVLSFFDSALAICIVFYDVILRTFTSYLTKMKMLVVPPYETVFPRGKVPCCSKCFQKHIYCCFFNLSSNK